MRLLPATLLLVVASCSLGLDEAKITDGVGVDGGTPTGEGGTPTGEGGTPTGEGGTTPPVGTVSCTTDDACKSDHPCLKGKCDLTRKACTFDVCRPTACNVSACNAAAKSCGLPAPYRYRAGSFSLGTQISCARCAVAIYPWLYVVTPLGLLAFDVSSPASTNPQQVPVVGLGFQPTQIVQSGSRLWALGPPTGTGPSRVPLAYLDSPATPFVTKIEAHTVLATYSRSAAEGVTLFPRGGDGAVLVGPGTVQFPSTVVEPPLLEPFSLSAATVGGAPTAGVAVATSGKRLVLGTITGLAASFQTVDNIGATTAQAGPAAAMTATGNVSPVRQLAQTADGAVFWATAIHLPGPTTDGTTTRSVRGHFLIANDVGPIDGTAPIDIETYDVPGGVQPAGANVLAPIAMVDAKTALVATLAREAPAQTAVQFVRKEPIGVIKDGNAARRALIPVPITSFGAATASNGVAYLIANDQPGPPPFGTVYVFDPACPL